MLAPALILLWIGFGLATLVAGLLLAGLAGRQVRRAEVLIRREPVLVVVAGLAGAILLPIAAILMIATLVGAPLGVGILLGALPLLAFIGYLVSAIWIGDLLLQTAPTAQTPEPQRRPFVAALIGVVLLELLAIIPILSVVVMLASLVGFGAVLVLGFRTLRGPSPSVAQPSFTPPTVQPAAG